MPSLQDLNSTPPASTIDMPVGHTLCIIHTWIATHTLITPSLTWQEHSDTHTWIAHTLTQ